MTDLSGAAPSRPPPRLDWADTAKGICIILVVLMHVAGGFEVAQGHGSWIDPLIDWAKQFRMPAFFLLAGLFAPRVIGKRWPEFLDRKITLLVYLYLLWLAIHCLLKFPSWGEGDLAALFGGYALGLVQPFGMLWFIYLLAVFFVAAKAMRGYPAVSWLVAAAIATVPETTGWLLVDAFAAYFVFFLSGVLFAPAIIRFAGWVGDHRAAAFGLCLGWAAASAALTGLIGHQALHESFAADLVLGHAGALGIIALSALFAGRLGWIAACGRNSLPIYLAFFVPMAALRTLLLRSGVEFDVGLASLAITGLCVVLPLVLHRLVRGTVLGWLFERPRWLAGAQVHARGGEPAERVAATNPEGGIARPLNSPAGR